MEWGEASPTPYVIHLTYAAYPLGRAGAIKREAVVSPARPFPAWRQDSVLAPLVRRGKTSEDRLAILPDLPHYEVAAAPIPASAVLPFLKGNTGPKRAPARKRK